MPAEGLKTILLISDDPPVLEHTRLLLQGAGIEHIQTLADSSSTFAFLEQQNVALIVLDITPRLHATDLLSRICSEYPHIPVIAETVSGDVEMAVSCMKIGVADYLVRPVEPTRMIVAVETALTFSCVQQETSSLKEYLLNDRLRHADAFAEIKTISRKMRSVFQYTEAVAGSPQALLVTGETGVGKELFAHAIHRISGVKGPFISINVAGLDDAMFSDTLFGHKKGAFTGADQYRDGLVSKAAGGTLFLDEIGDLNELSQVKLLRLLQEREYYPVGADIVKTSSARIVLATNVDLLERIRAGRFRRDLYYRLCTHQIHIPALRERREDIPLLLDSIMEDAARHFGKNVPAVSPELIRALAEYDFPGNVRELQARVRDAVARHDGTLLSLADFPDIPVPGNGPITESNVPPMDPGMGVYSLFGRLPTFREIEDYLVMEALKLSEGNYAGAASLLGVTRQTISKRLKSVKSVC